MWSCVLYSNIKPDHAIEVISLHLHLKTDILRKYKLDLISIRNILRLIFENIFKYKDNFLSLTLILILYRIKIKA
jgi:hypothetical protein